ncbi:hypothetical protein [Microcoleus sp. AR_TQ3_B6]|uniref:hypothetical protein n=1 Tax=Microcoleus sp. AR_TQ3_B6 TaxID=3055284 RepID=UPI002FD140DC
MAANIEQLTGFINLEAIELYSEYNLLAKILTVGLGHELCDRAWQLGLLTVYAPTAGRGCCTYLSQKVKLIFFTRFGIAV